MELNLLYTSSFPSHMQTSFWSRVQLESVHELLKSSSNEMFFENLMVYALREKMPQRTRALESCKAIPDRWEIPSSTNM